MKHIILIFFAPICCMAAVWGQTTQTAQEDQELQPASIMMRGEVHDGKALIRWVPTDAKTWRLLNQHGVQLERVTWVRDGKLLDEPETMILYDCLKPAESDEFKQIAAQYPYAAIMAQAIFGESFVVSGMGNQDVASIIAQSEELQQRFAFSLYAADLCFPAAVVAGWGWEDETVKRNEKYLYRVTPLVPETDMEITEGALFVDADRIDRFPKPLDFYGRFMDGSVLLVWNSRVHESLYAAYIPERSTDGVNFVPITETPISKMDSGDSGQIIYADSISNDVTYYYRLAAVTPFGSRSEYSDTISGIARRELEVAPLIVKAVPDQNGGASIEWEFDPEFEPLVSHFALKRSDDDRKYQDLVTPIDKKARSVTVVNIPSTSYFAVAAHTVTGKEMRSFSVLVQPVDSIPPAVPVGLTAIADTAGVVRLSWQNNREADFYGYRIYRAQTRDEELIPLNDIAIRDTVFVDSLDLRSLNSHVYYAMTSLDERYNQSDKSAVVEVKKPEVIPPTPPFIRQITVENGSNMVVWAGGLESNLAGYDLYRKNGSDDFVLLASIPGRDSCRYADSDVENNRVYHYRVRSRSEGGLVSDPSPAYRVTAIKLNPANEKDAIALNIVFVKNRVKLSWKAPSTDRVNVQIYKKSPEGSFELFGDGLAPNGETFDDGIIPGSQYEYMLVVKNPGATPQTLVKSFAL